MVFPSPVGRHAPRERLEGGSFAFKLERLARKPLTPQGFKFWVFNLLKWNTIPTTWVSLIGVPTNFAGFVTVTKGYWGEVHSISQNIHDGS